MSFRLSWASLSSVPTGTLSIAAEGAGFTLARQAFGPSGTTGYADINIPATTFDFRLFLFDAKDRIAVDLKGIGADDVFVVTAIFPGTFLASFFHQTAGVVGTCTIVCPDGTQGQGCIVCRDPPLVIRICC